LLIDPKVDGEEEQGIWDLPSDPSPEQNTRMRLPASDTQDLNRHYSEDRLLSAGAYVSPSSEGKSHDAHADGKGRKRAGIRESLLGYAECTMFWSRPWAMFDEYVLMLWVVVFTLRLGNITAVEASDYVIIPGMTGLKLLTGSALSLTAVRWNWFRSSCTRKFPGALSVIVLVIWFGLYCIRTPDPPQTIRSVSIFNEWLVDTRRLVDFQAGEKLPVAAGNCNLFWPAKTGLTGNCNGDSPLYTLTDSGSDLSLEWVAGLDTAAITKGVVMQQGDSYLFEIDIELQLLMAELHGKYCLGGGTCGNINSVLTFGRRPCAQELTPEATPGSDFCNCAGGSAYFGYKTDSRWTLPQAGSQQCSKLVFSDPEPVVGWPEWPPHRAECFCQTPGTLDPQPRYVRLVLRATCAQPQCLGYDMIGNLSLADVSINPMLIDVPVTANVPILGQIKLNNNWTDAAGIIEGVVRQKVPGYLNGLAKIPHIKGKLLPIVNRLIRLNMNGGN
jgi:hypothetical protein